MILFPKRRELVAQVQTALGLKPDGIDGRLTWRAIGERLLTVDHPALKPLEAQVSSSAFNGRIGIVAAAQAQLRISVDGRDGSETWAALAEAFIGKPKLPPAAPHLGKKYPEKVYGRSPNRNAGANECKGIVIHHAAGWFDGTISWCLQADTHAGYHCLVAPDGQRAILGRDEDRLHHAGKSSWRGRQSCNSFMLGIAFTGNTNTGAMRPQRNLTAAEIESAVEWIREKQKLYNIPLSEITHHRVISPGRKDDLSLDAWDQMIAALRA
jgi:hypothetical protein